MAVSAGVLLGGDINGGGVDRVVGVSDWIF